MDGSFEHFLLYYTAWHEGEFTLAEFREAVLAEIGAAGLREALAALRSKRPAPVPPWVMNTYHDAAVRAREGQG